SRPPSAARRFGCSSRRPRTTPRRAPPSGIATRSWPRRGGALWGAPAPTRRNRYANQAEAGVEVWELPDTVVHAKVVVADDLVSFGTVNLDAWALYRNSEIMMIARSRELGELLEERMFEADIARAKLAEPPIGARERLECW